MFRTLCHLTAAAALAAGVLWAAPADACEKHRAKKGASAQVEKQAKTDGPAAQKSTAKTTVKASEVNPLAPVDEVLSATCSCSGPSDCTCKKGECECKKCNKHHGVKSGAGSTRLMEPLQNQQRSPAVPANVRLHATGGVLI